MLRLCALAGKNLLAVVLVVAGVAMLFLPGQGILTILVGLGLLSVPGKRKLELWIVRRPAVLRAIQWIRARSNRPALQLPERPPTRS
ncbi:MAG: hypothetical protein O7D96_12545 [SAR324 cluster bacterium]|nr:hypothetical protein [SAR324 cluster bacterium]